MLNTVVSEDSHAVIPSYLLSNENDAAPYTRWHPEIFHYTHAIYWTNCCRGSLGLSPIGGKGVFTEDHARLIVLGNFKEHWVTRIGNARGTFGKQFPFFLIADEVNGHNTVGQYKYRSKPDVAFFKDDFPRFLAEFGSLTNQDSKHRLLVQMACALRLAFRRADGCHDKNFFLMGAFFTKEWHIYRYFFYSNEGKVCYLERDFNMAHADDLITFLHEFYNYIFYINVADTLGDKIQSITALCKDVEEGFPDPRVFTRKGRDRTKGQGNQIRIKTIQTGVQNSGFEVRDVEYSEEYKPFTKLPAHVVEATSPNGDRVVAKLVRKHSSELSLLQELSTQTSLYNHAIPLLDTALSSLGPLAIMPHAAPLLEFITLHLYGDKLRGESVRLSCELIEGVAFLHRQMIAHLDIKPNNLVVYRRRLYIIDFDVAVRCKDADEMVEMSCGTRGWSAPEIALDDNEAPRAFSPLRADLWSCGKVLQFIAEKAGQKHSNIRQLVDLLTHSDPRRRPLLHEVVDEGTNFWASGRLLEAVRRQVCYGKGGAPMVERNANKLKRACDDASHVSEEMSKFRRVSVLATPPSFFPPALSSLSSQLSSVSSSDSSLATPCMSDSDSKADGLLPLHTKVDASGGKREFKGIDV